MLLNEKVLHKNCFVSSSAKCKTNMEKVNILNQHKLALQLNEMEISNYLNSSIDIVN